MKNLINLIKEINIYHTFKPSIKMWTATSRDNSHHHFLEDETYYGGTWFKTGYFIFINTNRGKRPGIVIKIIWWKLDVFKPLKKK